MVVVQNALLPRTLYLIYKQVRGIIRRHFSLGFWLRREVQRVRVQTGFDAIKNRSGHAPEYRTVKALDKSRKARRGWLPSPQRGRGERDGIFRT